MPASESDLIFTRRMQVLVPLIGSLLGAGFEFYTSAVHNLNVSNNLGFAIAFFAAMVGLSGTLVAGIFGSGAVLKKIGVHFFTWDSLLAYLRETVSLSILGFIVALIALGLGKAEPDTIVLNYMLAAIGGAALLTWASGIFAVITCAQIMFTHSEGPDLTPRVVSSADRDKELSRERRIRSQLNNSNPTLITEERMSSKSEVIPRRE